MRRVYPTLVRGTATRVRRFGDQRGSLGGESRV
jgi:hypothetical protein